MQRAGEEHLEIAQAQLALYHKGSVQQQANRIEQEDAEKHQEQPEKHERRSVQVIASGGHASPQQIHRSFAAAANERR